MIRSDPAVGTKPEAGLVVTLYVSKGTRPVAVPNVKGRKQSAAETMLTAVGFQVSVTQVFSDTVGKGVVVEQNPSTGTADKGSRVTLTVSKGPDILPVPDVRGDSRDDAKRKLEAVGLKADVQALPGGPGIVIQTDPRPGRKVKRGTKVILYVF